MEVPSPELESQNDLIQDVSNLVPDEIITAIMHESSPTLEHTNQWNHVSSIIPDHYSTIEKSISHAITSSTEAGPSEDNDKLEKERTKETKRIQGREYRLKQKQLKQQLMERLGTERKINAHLKEKIKDLEQKISYLKKNYSCSCLLSQICRNIIGDVSEVKEFGNIGDI